MLTCSSKPGTPLICEGFRWVSGPSSDSLDLERRCGPRIRLSDTIGVLGPVSRNSVVRRTDNHHEKLCPNRVGTANLVSFLGAGVMVGVKQVLRSQFVGGRAQGLIGALATAIVFSPFLTSGFEVHHQGLMLASAIGIRDGFGVHTEVFSQYGPFVPFTQALFLLLPFSPGVNLNLWALTCFSLTTYFLTKLPYVMPRSWHVPKTIGFFASAIWVLLSTTFTNGYLWSWSSVMGSLIVVAAAYLLLRAIRGAGASSIRSRKRSLFVAGLLYGILPFVRLEVGLSTWLALALLALVPALRNAIFGEQARAVIGGMLTAILVATGFLFATSAARGFFTQSIIVPVTAGVGGSQTFLYFFSELSGAFGGFLPRTIPLLLLVCVSGIMLRFRRPGPVASAALALLQSAFLVLALVYASGLQDPALALVMPTGSPQASGIGLLASAAVTDLIFFALLLAFTLPLLAWVLTYFGETRKLDDRQLANGLIALFLLSLGGLSQVFPLADANHAWWGLPLALFVMLWSGSRFARVIALRALVLLPALALMGLVSVLASSDSLSKANFLAPTDSIISGMTVSPPVGQFIVDSHELIGQTLGPSERALYATVDGLVAVVDGSFRPDNVVFVSWAAQRNVDFEDMAPNQKLVIDFPSLSYYGADNFGAFARDTGLTLMRCSTTSYWEQWDPSEPYLCVFEKRGRL